MQRCDVMFCQIVDVSSLLHQQTGNTFVAVMGRDVKRSETTFGRDIGIVITLQK